MTFKELNITGLNLSKGGSQKVLCPKCSHTRKNKADKCLSVDVDKEIGHCHNCNWSFSLHTKEYVKEYARPAEPGKLDLAADTIKWFADTRKISANTLRQFKVTESKQWMPAKEVDGKMHEAKERNCICFNYYRGTQLVNIKYRDGLKNFRLVKDAELIFYNINSIKGMAECIICEGEIDAMSFHEAGYVNVVSVPNGAGKKRKLEYLDNCVDYFTDLKKIFIATDGDDAGRELQQELIRRLGSERCYTIEYPEGNKDANEVLIKHGKEGVKKLINEAKSVPLEGVFVIDKSNSLLNDIYLNGYPPALRIGYSELDELLRWQLGDLTIITGIPNHGKSQWLDQLMVRLATRHDWKFGIFSPENQPIELHVIKLVETFTGQAYYHPDKSGTMSEAVRDVSLDILRDDFFLMKIEDIDITINGILDKAREMVLRYGINALVIDPYNCIEHQVPKGYTETQYISELLEKIRKFKLKYNVHVFLVAHPKKMAKRSDGQYEVPDLYDIAGSSHFYNKADNGVTIYRCADNSVDVHVQKIRWKWNGKQGSVKFSCDVPTGRYAEIGKGYISELMWLKQLAEKTKMSENGLKDLSEPDSRLE